MLLLPSRLKSGKILKVEEIETLVRMLTSALESIRYAQGESSTESNIIINNRLLTARISALSALINYVSEGEIAQICNFSGPIPDPLTSDSSPRFLPEERTAPTLTNEPKSTQEDSTSDGENDEDVESESAHNPVCPSKASSPVLFESIRGLLGVLHTGIVNDTSNIYASPSSSKMNAKSGTRGSVGSINTASGSVYTPVNEPVKNRSEYEMGDISSVDLMRRPVSGIAAPAPLSTYGAIPGGGPIRGNLSDIKRSRRPIFVSKGSSPIPTISGTSVNNSASRKHRLEGGDDNRVPNYKRRHVYRMHSDPSLPSQSMGSPMTANLSATNFSHSDRESAHATSFGSALPGKIDGGIVSNLAELATTKEEEIARKTESLVNNPLLDVTVSSIVDGDRAPSDAGEIPGTNVYVTPLLVDYESESDEEGTLNRKVGLVEQRDEEVLCTCDIESGDDDGDDES